MTQWFYTVKVHHFSLEETLSSRFSWISSIQLLHANWKHRILQLPQIYLYTEFLPLICAAALHRNSFWLEKMIKDRELGISRATLITPISWPSFSLPFCWTHLSLSTRDITWHKTQSYKLNLLGTSVQTPDLFSENLIVWGLIWDCLRKTVILNTVV